MPNREVKLASGVTEHGRKLYALYEARFGRKPERFGVCSNCPAYTFADESLATGLCHGCRSPKPEMRIETGPGQCATPKRS